MTLLLLFHGSGVIVYPPLEPIGTPTLTMEEKDRLTLWMEERNRARLVMELRPHPQVRITRRDGG